ncbi:hypothetical protein GGS26DRAFT_537583 [Hypomontagnella submonticulosa]|nr:hypothetical protein GGS26DRAFT_537583 [Hypomontagnella submonticulosa]
MPSLLDIIEEYISWKSPAFIGFGLSDGIGMLPTWTVVSLSINGVLDESRAVEKLQQLENDIDTRLSVEEKPRRLAFLLEDNSGNMYMAKSWRVQGKRRVTTPVLPAPGAEEELENYRKIRL